MDQPETTAAGQPHDRAALRDRIADAIRDAACPGDCDKTEAECTKERIQPVVWHHGRLAVVEGEPGMFADAVLAVLPEPADRGDPPLSPDYEHPECGFHWRGRDGMDIPMRDGQPVCPRCELAAVEKRLHHLERRRAEVGDESRRRGKRVVGQSVRIRALEREIDGIRRQLGAEILRADTTEAELRRLADEAKQPTAGEQPDTRRERQRKYDKAVDARLPKLKGWNPIDRNIAGLGITDAVMVVADEEQQEMANATVAFTAAIRRQNDNLRTMYDVSERRVHDLIEERDGLRAEVEQARTATLAEAASRPDALPETDEQREDRIETERAHAADDHEYCGVDCEVKFPSDMLRNGILAKGYPGTAGMLNELLRRAGQPCPAAVQPGPVSEDGTQQ